MRKRLAPLLLLVSSLGCSLLFRIQAEQGATACSDKEDNDRDGKLDCFDESCFLDPVCRVTGEACTGPEECAAVEQGNQACLEDELGATFLGGYCSELCDLNGAQPCSNEKAACIRVDDANNEEGACFATCVDNTDCRSDGIYGCVERLGEVSLCLPGSPEDCTNVFDDDFDGFPDCLDLECLDQQVCEPGFGILSDPCLAHSDCSVFSGPEPLCLSEAVTGFPGGFCSDYCDASDPLSCGFDAFCQDFNFPPDTDNPNLGLCLILCDVLDVGGCREGYECFDDNGDLLGVCAPSCDEDADCPDIGNCNLDLGLCTPPEDCNNGVDDDGDRLADCIPDLQGETDADCDCN